MQILITNIMTAIKEKDQIDFIIKGEAIVTLKKDHAIVYGKRVEDGDEVYNAIKKWIGLAKQQENDPNTGIGSTTDDSKFKKELENLINSHSRENESNTPDFILAEYMSDCLIAFEKTSNAREKWYGKKLSILDGE